MNRNDLNENQFLKIRLDARGYAVLFKIQQLKPTRWTYTSEIKADVLELILSESRWAADVLAARLNNVILEAFRKYEINGYRREL